ANSSSSNLPPVLLYLCRALFLSHSTARVPLGIGQFAFSELGASTLPFPRISCHCRLPSLLFPACHHTAVLHPLRRRSFFLLQAWSRAPSFPPLRVLFPHLPAFFAPLFCHCDRRDTSHAPPPEVPASSPSVTFPPPPPLPYEQFNKDFYEKPSVSDAGDISGGKEDRANQAMGNASFFLWYVRDR
ncbi:hypothetical protein Taro_051860, partial [Colocasia esculenta]|nr:hypothetical protein [Colocasia esculenta]